MSKIFSIVLIVSVLVCQIIIFSGCSEKERTTAEIKALYSTMLAEYPTYFDDSGDFQIKFSNDVNNLITTNEKTKLISNYFLPISKYSLTFFVNTTDEINDANWSVKDRTQIYNKLQDFKDSLYEFNNSKERFENSFVGYVDGELNNIQFSNLTNFVKEFSYFIENMLSFGTQYVDSYFGNVGKEFYNYDGLNIVSTNELKVFLYHKLFSISKISYNLEAKEYFDIDKLEFSSTVKGEESTKLIDEINKVSQLLSLSNDTINDAPTKQVYKKINNSNNFYLKQEEIFYKAMQEFDFEKMRRSSETESVYVSNLSVEQREKYNLIMYIAYDYVSQNVANLVQAYNIINK